MPCNDSSDSILGSSSGDSVEDDSEMLTFDADDDDAVGDEIVEFRKRSNEEVTPAYALLLEEHHPWSFSDDDIDDPGVKRQRL